jgi:imidazolonepropionase-like amidohydrolase
MIAGRALEGLAIMREAGVSMGFGTDLLGPLQDRQPTEFTLRSRALPTFDVLRSATSINARMIGLGEEIGTIAEGFAADLLLVEGDPLRDISLLAEPDRGLAIVMKQGRFSRRAF